MRPTWYHLVVFGRVLLTTKSVTLAFWAVNVCRFLRVSYSVRMGC